jgi:hypothetical protein
MARLAVQKVFGLRHCDESDGLPNARAARPDTGIPDTGMPDPSMIVETAPPGKSESRTADRPTDAGRPG